MFIYNERTEAFTGTFDPAKCDATKCYLTHYDNILTLQFFQKNSKDARESKQIERELEIGRRKLKYWSNQATYDHKSALDGAMILKQKWEGKL